MSRVSPAKEVVVLRDPQEQKTKSGLYLPPPDSEHGKPSIGVVISFGKGVKPVDFKEGDRVIFNKYGENEMEVDGEAYNLIRFKDVLGVID